MGANSLKGILIWHMFTLPLYPYCRQSIYHRLFGQVKMHAQSWKCRFEIGAEFFNLLSHIHVAKCNSRPLYFNRKSDQRMHSLLSVSFLKGSFIVHSNFKHDVVICPEDYFVTPLCKDFSELSLHAKMRSRHVLSLCKNSFLVWDCTF